MLTTVLAHFQTLESSSITKYTCLVIASQQIPKRADRGTESHREGAWDSDNETDDEIAHSPSPMAMLTESLYPTSFRPPPFSR